MVIFMCPEEERILFWQNTLVAQNLILFRKKQKTSIDAVDIGMNIIHLTNGGNPRNFVTS
ncbi:MAG: hypothetical protein R3B47_16420 [Bacteroidia bacterium]